MSHGLQNANVLHLQLAIQLLFRFKGIYIKIKMNENHLVRLFRHLNSFQMMRFAKRKDKKIVFILFLSDSIN